MDNQHRKITGYRELDAQEISYMNNVKSMGNSIAALIEEMEETMTPTPDLRWLAIAKTDLQKGIMSLVRSIAKPESF